MEFGILTPSAIDPCGGSARGTCRMDYRSQSKTEANGLDELARPATASFACDSTTGLMFVLTDLTARAFCAGFLAACEG